ncbi:hypothetical protein ACA910_015916 [Epithemia clementina (nom. ined.)]
MSGSPTLFPRKSPRIQGSAARENNDRSFHYTNPYLTGNSERSGPSPPSSPQQQQPQQQQQPLDNRNRETESSRRIYQRPQAIRTTPTIDTSTFASQPYYNSHNNQSRAASDSSRTSNRSTRIDTNTMNESPGSSSSKIRSLLDQITGIKKQDYHCPLRGVAMDQTRHHFLNEMASCLEHTSLGVYEWSLEKAMALVNAVLIAAVMPNKQTPQTADDAEATVVISAWKILHVAISEWWSPNNDPLCYAVLVQELNGVDAFASASVLDVLQKMACGAEINDDDNGMPIDSSHQNGGGMPKGTLRTTETITGAAACLASAWRCLERIQYKTANSSNISVSGDRVWWIELHSKREDWSLLVAWALGNIHPRDDLMEQQSNNSAVLLLSREEAQSASMTLLRQLLQYGYDDWVNDRLSLSLPHQETNHHDHNHHRNKPHRHHNIEEFVICLLEQAERLRDPSMPFSSYARLSFSSFHLLLVLTQKLALDGLSATTSSRIERLANDLSLWEHLWHQVTTIDGGFNNKQAATWAIPLLHQRLACIDSNQSTGFPIHENNRKCYSSLNSMWIRLLQQGGRTDESICARLQSLWSCVPGILRKSLGEVLNDDRSQKIVDNEEVPNTTRELVACLVRGAASKNNHSDDSSYQHSLLLLKLLMDASSHDDDLSRVLRKEITSDERVQTLFDSVVYRAQECDDTSKPILLVLLDLLFIIVARARAPAKTHIHNLFIQSAEKVEAVIGVMTPSDARGTMDLDETTLSINSTESDKSTPTANNLSRIGGAGVDLSTVEIRFGTEVRGITKMVQLAAASFLGSLIACHPSCSMDEPIVGSDPQHAALVRRRIDETTGLFASEFFKANDELCHSSIETTMEWTIRRMRLVSVMMNSDKFGFVAGLLHSSHLEEMTRFAGLRKAVADTERRLVKYQQIETQLVAKNSRLQTKLEAKSSQFVRERSLIERHFKQEAKHALDIQAGQLRKAEHQLQETKDKLKRTEKRALEMEKEAEESKEYLERATASLQEMKEELAKSTAHSQELESTLKKSQVEVRTLTDQLRSTTETLETVKGKEQAYLQRIEEQDENLATMEHSYEEMQQSLECLFADMVSLAQLYEIKEKEATGSRKDVETTIAKLKRDLESERKRNDQLETRQRQVEYENDALSKKYAKVREKLEEERSSRRAAAEEADHRKRTQPISYMNHLNASRLSNKENSHSSSSSFNRSKAQSRKGRLD